jgi:hypothetical protein
MTSETPYVCPYCGQTFTKNSTLRSHIRKVHKEEVEKRVSTPTETEVERKEGKTSLRISEASIKEFEEFEPESAKRKEKETTMDKIYKMLLEGKVVKVEGSRGQLLSVLGSINSKLYRDYRVSLKAVAEYKLDVKKGVLYIRLVKRLG